MHSTRLSKVVRHFKHVSSGFCVECVQREQVRGSIQVDFVIKATLQEWKCYFVPKMDESLGQWLKCLDQSSNIFVIN